VPRQPGATAGRTRTSTLQRAEKKDRRACLDIEGSGPDPGMVEQVSSPVGTWSELDTMFSKSAGRAIMPPAASCPRSLASS